MSNTMDYRNMFSLENKIVIITGGAGHLGSAMSKALVDFGAQVKVVGRNEARLKEFVAQNQPPGENRLEYFVCDICNEADFQEVVEELTAGGT